MSATVFPHRIEWAGGITGGRMPRLSTTTAVDGTIYARNLDSGSARYDQQGAVVLDGSEGHGLADWIGFQENTLDGGAESVLVKLDNATDFLVEDESIGTVSGSGETFALDSKFIDADTLKVSVAGVLQTLTTDYTFTGNNTAPLITSTASMDTGAATATYERYFQCYVIQTGPHAVLRFEKQPPDGTLATRQHLVKVPVRIVEVTPGGHLA